MNRDLAAVAAAVAVHAGVAFALSRAPLRAPEPVRVVEVDVRRKAPPPPLPPPPQPKVEKPPPPPEPPKPRPRVKKPPPPQPAQAPIPNETKKPVEPPKEPPKPVFGVTMSSTTEGDSSFTVPLGNTTIADPSKRPKNAVVQPLAPPPPGAVPAPVFRPASEDEVATYPDFEEGSCDAIYPDGPAKDQGIQGETILKVEIDERGKVHGVRVLRGVGHGLDELAAKLVRTKCKYKPAISKAGRPVPLVIEHRVRWQID